MDSSSDTRKTKLQWKVLSTGSGIVGGVVVRRALQAVWSSLGPGDQDPPLNPADRRIDWSTALQWAIAAGVGAGLGRLVSQRAAAAGWEAATGSPPPGVKT